MEEPTQYQAYFESPIGWIQVVSSDSKVLSILFEDSGPEPVESQHSIPEILKESIQQLGAYFRGERKVFDFEMELAGTPFQLKVWNELKKLPYGRTISYRDLSARLGQLKAIRAVGRANGTNPLAIAVPCHRVIGSDGKLVGYGGKLWRKKWLLEHELKFERGLQFLFGNDV